MTYIGAIYCWHKGYNLGREPAFAHVLPDATIRDWNQPGATAAGLFAVTAGSPRHIFAVGPGVPSLVTARVVVDSTESRGATHPVIAKLGAATPVILPSLLLCDFGHLADEVARLEAAGAEALHLDVMDGHFVPNFTYGLTIVEAVRKLTELPLETHLMISNPADYVDYFHEAGADLITIHCEAVDDPRPLLDRVRNRGSAAGLAINPPTPVSAVEEFLDDCDLLLVMSVMPGFGGQAFDPTALAKLRQLRGLVNDPVLLSVDGGIHEQTIADCARAGADLFVSGSAIFSSDDYRDSMMTLRRLAGWTGH